MRYIVRLFGAEAQCAGRGTVEVESDAPVDASALVRLVETTEPKLAGRLGNCRVAVNHEFVEGDAVISEGDEIALIGAVSGG